MPFISTKEEIERFLVANPDCKIRIISGDELQKIRRILPKEWTKRRLNNKSVFVEMYLENDNNERAYYEGPLLVKDKKIWRNGVGNTLMLSGLWKGRCLIGVNRITDTAKASDNVSFVWTESCEVWSRNVFDWYLSKLATESTKMSNDEELKELTTKPFNIFNVELTADGIKEEQNVRLDFKYHTSVMSTWIGYSLRRVYPIQNEQNHNGRQSSISTAIPARPRNSVANNGNQTRVIQHEEPSSDPGQLASPVGPIQLQNSAANNGNQTRVIQHEEPSSDPGQLASPVGPIQLQNSAANNGNQTRVIQHEEPSSDPGQLASPVGPIQLQNYVVNNGEGSELRRRNQWDILLDNFTAVDTEIKVLKQKKRYLETEIGNIDKKLQVCEELRKKMKVVEKSVCEMNNTFKTVRR